MQVHHRLGSHRISGIMRSGAVWVPDGVLVYQIK
jgi:hypothetical protein